MKLTIDASTGYLTVSLSPKNSHTQARVHRIVMETFSPHEDKSLFVCHIDGNKQNNHLQNLRWDTAIGNMHDKYKHGTMPIGKKNPNAKLTEEIVKAMRNSPLSGAELGRTYGVTKETVNGIRRREAWKHVE